MAFDLPLNPIHSEGIGPQKPGPSTTPLQIEEDQPIRALVVDDNQTNRDVLTQFLRETGCEIREAESNAAALEILTKEYAAEL